MDEAPSRMNGQFVHSWLGTVWRIVVVLDHPLSSISSTRDGMMVMMFVMIDDDDIEG